MKCIVFVEASNTGAGEISCKYAKETGYVVVLFCKDILNYKKNILDSCDEVIELDTSKISLLIEAAYSLSKKYEIKAVTTTSDFFVLQTAQLSEYLGLPGNRPSVVDKIKNKYKMRNAIHEINPSLNPKYILANDITEAFSFANDVGFPFIAKPVNGNDSLYVKKMNSINDLKDYFNHRNNWGLDISGQDFESGILLEKNIDGEEFCLDLLKSFNGKLILIGAFKKKISGLEFGNFIKIGASFPAPSYETNLLFHSIAPVVEKLGYSVGAINIDCKIENGFVKILEMNPRLVGDQMGSHMIELSTGINPAHAVVDMAFGEEIDWYPKKSKGVAIHRLTMPAPGYFGGINHLDEIKKINHVEYVNILGEIGKWYEPALSNQGVIGSIIVSHESAELAMELASNLAKNAEIKVNGL